ncbi:type II toxin-antitoxin system HicA family toxin [Giesbergeria anulus]|uniref:HicA toxin of toxin-antitoxin n=1 Tax=Giesbergeria anulus TaxID=180197 RepID=A0A1H9RNS9_9BURK|nr:HicA toxin of toxin-antitoxin [Giesbergeria anulus]
MNGYYQQVIAQLKQHGYSFLRQGKGSHEIWSNGLRNQTVSKNMPARDMANAIMKQAGIAHRF